MWLYNEDEELELQLPDNITPQQWAAALSILGGSLVSGLAKHQEFLEQVGHEKEIIRLKLPYRKPSHQTDILDLSHYIK